MAESVIKSNSPHTFDTSVTIPLGTTYTCPSDGYATVFLGNTPSAYVLLYLNDIELINRNVSGSQTTLTSLRTTVYVRKGMTIRAEGTTNATLGFRPLI